VESNDNLRSTGTLEYSLRNMKKFEELSQPGKLSVCMCKECLMSNRVKKLSKTHRMESLAYFVRPPVLDTNTKVSQKLIGTDEEEMVMIKQ